MTASAAAITGPILHDQLPIEQSLRHRVPIGWVVTTSEPVTVPARGVNLLIQGDPHSGKSWLTGALVERLVSARYSVCVIDPEGDYRVLANLPGMASAEIREPGDVDRALDDQLHDPAASVVLDLSTLPHAAKVAVIERALSRVRGIRQRVGRPHWVVIDEAHYSLHRQGVDDAALGLEDRGFCFVTYRPSWLRERVAQAVDMFLVSRTTAPDELGVLEEAFPPPGADGSIAEVLAHLPRGEFLAVQRDPAGRRATLTFVPAPRQTVHVRHLTKYLDTQVPAGREFLFRRPDGRVTGSANSLHAFRRAVLPGAGADVLMHHAGAGDFSRWVRDVFGDAELARQLRKIETRWSRGELKDFRRAMDAVDHRPLRRGRVDGGPVLGARRRAALAQVAGSARGPLLGRGGRAPRDAGPNELAPPRRFEAAPRARCALRQPAGDHPAGGERRLGGASARWSTR